MRFGVRLKRRQKKENSKKETNDVRLESESGDKQVLGKKFSCFESTWIK